MFNTGKSECTFYQRGECKFGAKCWNLHSGASNSQSNSGFGNSGANVFARLGSAPATSFPAPASTEPKDANEFIKQVIAELTPWDKNLMWPLSSLTPLKGCPLVPGFTDTSMEECRINAYEALKANKPEMHQTFFREKLDDHNRVLQAYRTAAPECKEALNKIFMDNAAKTGGKTNSVFGSSSPGLFGAKSTPTSSPFGSQPSTSGGSMFGGGASSAFGTSNAFKPASVFGASSNSTFGRSQSTGTAFGATGQSAFGSSAQSVFGSSAFGSQNQSTNAFGSGSKSVFGSSFGSSNNSLFGNSNPQNQSAFGANAQTSSFGSGQSSAFGAGTASSGFGSSTFGKSPSVFGSSGFGSTPTSVSSPFQSGTSVFGQSQNSAFGGATQTSTGSQPAPGFGKTSSVFGQTSSSSGFGSSQNSAFGQSNFGSSFGAGTNNQTSSFGAGTSNQTSSFGASTSNQTSSFGASTNNQSSSFGSPNPQPFGSATQSPGGFGPVSNSTSFGGASPSSTPFGASTSSPFASTTIQGNTAFGQITPQPTPSSPFAPVPPQTSSPFMQNTTQPPGAFVSSSQPSATSFGTNNSQGFGNASSERVTTDASHLSTISEESSRSTITTSNSSTNGSIYSDISSLSEEDLAQFKAEEFTYVPHCPPPLELC